MKWIKKGRVFNPKELSDRPRWMYEYAQAPCVLLFDTFIRVYFCCRPPRDEDGQFVSYAAFVDLDRKDLFKIKNVAKKPVLELGKLGTFDEFGTYPISVIRHGKEVWAYYAGWTRCESVPFNVAIGLGRSTNNGRTFEKLGDGPLLSYTPDEPFTIGGPKIRMFNGKYYLFYIAGDSWILEAGRPEISHKIRIASSDDGINWTRHNKNIIPDSWGENESQASPDVFFSNGKYHMFFCGWVPKKFRETHSRKIGYAWSINLVDWTRDDSKAGIDISKDGFDNEMVAYPHVFELDGEIFMLYLGNQVGRYGFGLAQLEGTLT